MSQLKTIYDKVTSRMEPAVFGGAAGLVLAFLFFGSSYPKSTSEVFSSLQNFIITYFGWFYILSATLILIFILYILLSPFGKIRLGGKDARPDFSYFAWFTMLFSAGMGTGLVFWSVAEPVMHYDSPPLAESSSTSAMRESLQYTFFHWGLHPWAIYTLFGLALAYYHFRFKLPLAPRSMLYPLIGNRIYGWLGHLVDILATVGTLLGVATSLGLGAMQINAGISFMSDLGQSTNIQVMLIAGITLVATASVVLGLDKGISRLSRFNILLAIIFMLFLFLAGPTVYLLNTFVTGVGSYLQNLPFMSLWISSGEGAEWQSDWTLFYWAWWISWSPFVGVFVARISRGRTVKEFILGVLFAPTLATFFWLAIFGGNGLYLQIQEGTSLLDQFAGEPAIALHTLLEYLPYTKISTVVATLLITIFFITSSDSGSFVDDMVTSGGDPNPPVAQKVFWAFSEGAVACTLLLTGGLEGLRTASLTSGLPMSIILLVSGVGLYKALSNDHERKGVPKKKELTKGSITE